MKTQAKSFKLLRLQILAYLNPPPLIQEEEFGPPKSLIYTLSLFEEGHCGGGMFATTKALAFQSTELPRLKMNRK